MFEMSSLELNSICRLCVQIFEKEKIFPIFNNESYDSKISLSERIKYCSSVVVSEDDGLPPQICNTCLLKLNESFVFRNQCVLADITLKRLKDFSFHVNEIPNLSKIDIENQVITLENNDFFYQMCSLPDQLKNGKKSKESIDEFDNSKNGRHKRSIHKLKSLNLQKRKALSQKPKEYFKNLNTSETVKTDILQSPLVPTLKKKEEKINKKDLRKKFAGKNVNNVQIKKNENIKRIEKLLKNHEILEDDLLKQDKTDMINFKEECRNLEGISSTSNIKEISEEFSIEDKNLNHLIPKKAIKKKLSFIKEKPSSFKCNYCQKVYPSEGGWRYHIHTMHNENYQPFICDLCGQAFKVKKNLEAHKNSIHFHLKHHLCDLCGRGFASKYSLKVHKSWHNDEKNFSCDVCGTKFRTRGKMNTHRSIHGGPKKFMCHICSRDFRWKKDFEIHMRTHTGEKPFKCSHCGKAFASLTNMKKHEKNHLKKVEMKKGSEKIDVIYLLNDGKIRRNETLDFGYGSEDVRNRQSNQTVSFVNNANCNLMLQ